MWVRMWNISLSNVNQQQLTCNWWIGLLSVLDMRCTLHDTSEEIVEDNGPQWPRMGASQQWMISLQRISRNESTLIYCRNNHLNNHWFPSTCTDGTQIRSPCSSMHSERQFSSASHILNKKRKTLSCNKAEMLVFEKKNIHLTKSRGWSADDFLKLLLLGRGGPLTFPERPVFVLEAFAQWEQKNLVVCMKNTRGES